MKMIDLASTRPMARAMAWHGWPTTLIRLITTGLLFFITGQTLMALTRFSADTTDAHPASSTSPALQQALAYCGQTIRSVREKLASPPEPTSTSQDTQGAQSDAPNWRIDSLGKQWVHDPHQSKWMRAP